MYELRNAGFEWKEIAQKLNTTDAAARASGLLGIQAAIFFFRAVSSQTWL